MTRLPLALIAAVARNGVIGRENGLPWRVAGDLKHFKVITTGKPVLMGRKTYRSIGRPLPGRFMVVLSRDPTFRPDGIAVARTLAEALERADAIGHDKGTSEIMVAGGGTLYAALIGEARRLYLTEVDLAPGGDTVFPTLVPGDWVERERVGHERAEGDDAKYATVLFERMS